MTRRLILIRHAKSDWNHPGMEDHDRPLNARGRDGSARIGRWLATASVTPDVVLVSTATRAMETWSSVSAEMSELPAPEFRRALYLADPDTIIDAVQSVAGETILVIGHNPGIAETAAMLTDAAPDHPDFQRYPTGATTLIRFETTIGPGKGITDAFVVPKDLD